MAPIRWRFGDTRVFVLPGSCWDEFWLQSYPNKYATLTRVVPARSIPYETEEQKRSIAMGAFDKIPNPGAGGGGGELPVDPGFTKRYPVLWEFLTSDRYAPDQPRERSGLTLHVEGGCFKLFLSEKTKEAGIDATGATLQACLDALEARLTSDSPGWRTTGRKPGRKR
jgi:hypothetical protein